MSILGVYVSSSSGVWWLAGMTGAFFLLIWLMPWTDDVYDREVGPYEDELDRQRIEEGRRR